MKRIFISFLLFVLILEAKSQSLFLSKIDSVSGLTLFRDIQFIKTLDKGYAISFRTNVNSTSCYGIIKLDSLAQTVWVRYYDYDYSFMPAFLIQRNDSTLIFSLHQGETSMFAMDGWNTLQISPDTGTIIAYGPGINRFMYDGGTLSLLLHDKHTDQIYFIGRVYGKDPMTEDPNRNDKYLMKYDNSFGVIANAGNDFFNNPSTNLANFYNIFPIHNPSNPGEYLIVSTYNTLIKKSNSGVTLWQKSYSGSGYPYLGFSYMGNSFLFRDLSSQSSTTTIHKIDSIGNTIFNIAFDSTRITNAAFNNPNSYFFIGEKNNQTIIFETDSNISVLKARELNHQYLNKTIAFNYKHLIDTVDDSFTFFYTNKHTSVAYYPMFIEKVDFDNACSIDTALIFTYPLSISDSITNLYHQSYSIGFSAPWVDHSISSSSQIVSCPTLNISANKKSTNFEIYPNPTNFSVKVTLPNYRTPINIYLKDMVGRICMKHLITSPNTILYLNGLNKGIYLIEIEGNVQKLLIQ